MAEREAVSMTTVNATNANEALARLEDVIEVARREIGRGKALTAQQLLRDIASEIEEHQGTKLWAKYALTRAEVAAGKNDPVAGTLLEEALESIKNLPEQDLDLEMRAHESFGNFLAGIRRLSRARQQYELAGQIATGRGLRVRNAEIKLKIVQIDLETDKDPEGKNFSTMMHVAYESGYTSEEQLAVWHQHLGKSKEATLGRVYARNASSASEAYFQGLFRSVRMTRDEQGAKQVHPKDSQDCRRN